MNQGLTPEEKKAKAIAVVNEFVKKIKSPKDKAVELVNKYLQLHDGRVQVAKKAALLCCEEMLESIGVDNRGYAFWTKVKQEIEIL